MACNCNDNGKVYNISMGCCVPVVANADNYYTKSEIDEKIDEIVISGGGITSGEVQTMIDESIADKADKSEIPTVPTKVSAFENDVPYLTQHQSLSGYATEQWVLDKHYISGVDLSDYATKEYVSGFTYDKATIDEKVAGGGTFDPTQYYTTANTYNKTEVNNLLDDKLDASAYTPCDLSNYYTKSETNNQISSATADMATMTWVGQQGYLTEHQSLSGYATEQWVEDKHYITGVDLSDYATEQWVENQGYLTEHQSLSGYATEQWVEDKHYITGVDLSDYALKSEIPTVPTSNTAFTNDAGYLTEHQSLSAYSTTQEVTNMINQSVSGKADTSAVTNINSGLTSHTSNTSIHVTQTEKNTWNSKVDSSTLNNYLLKSKIWCGTQTQYDAITTKDSETLYLIHS